MTDEQHSRVKLPAGAEPPYRVFISGVPQTQGEDFEIREGYLEFNRRLAKEGRLGFWRWTAMFLALFGTYRRNDSVDVQYKLHGSDHVATGLDIIAP